MGLLEFLSQVCLHGADRVSATEATDLPPGTDPHSGAWKLLFMGFYSGKL